MKSLVTALLCLAAIPALALPQPDPPALKAKSWVLMDYASGQILAAHEPALRIEPASLTKIMTVYVAFDAIRHGRVKPTDEVVVSEKAWRQGLHSRESRMFIEVGRRVTVNDLLHGIIVQSGNDASIAVAEHIGGSETTFAELMNRYAKNLGLRDTHFTNATGVPEPGLYTTAGDVALLSRALIRNFPQHYVLFREKQFVFNKIRQPNRNRLLFRDPAVDGIKTGHAEKPGYHLAASAVRDGRRLISVVIGADSESARAEASLALLNYGFRYFETITALAARSVVTTIRAWKGDSTELALGPVEPVTVSIPHGTRDRLKIAAQLDGPVFAPIAAGQVLGKLTVSLDGKVLRTEPLVALAALPEGSWWRRLSDEIQLWFEAQG